jgi:hypothetical protein
VSLVRAPHGLRAARGWSRQAGLVATTRPQRATRSALPLLRLQAGGLTASGEFITDRVPQKGKVRDATQRFGSAWPP